jgi:hypothetical protein
MSGWHRRPDGMLAESCAARGREAGWICAAESGGWLNVMPDGKHLGVGLATEHHDTGIVNWADELRSNIALGASGSATGPRTPFSGPDSPFSCRDVLDVTR